MAAAYYIIPQVRTSITSSGVTLNADANGVFAVERGSPNEQILLDNGAMKVSAAAGSHVGGGSGLTNPMTTAGDMIVGGASGAPQRVAIGANGQIWTVVSGNEAWANPADVVSSSPPINTQTAAGYHPILADAPQSSNYEGWVTMNNASANNVTLDPHGTTPWVVGTMIAVVQLGAGQSAFVAGGGVTFLNPSSLTARAQNSVIWAKYLGNLSGQSLGSDVWLIGGDLT
jgi:hypothetical protein